MDMKTSILACLLAACLLARAPLQAQAPVAAADGLQQRKYDYYYLEAIRMKLQNKYDAAFDLLQHCLAIRPDAASALYELAQCYLYLQQPAQAETLMEKAVRNAPDNYWYHQDLANLYIRQKKTELATDLLERMLRLFPDKPDPLYSLLDIYGRRQEYSRMIGIFNSLEQRLGKNEQFSMEKFRIYQQQGDSRKAVQEIESLAAEYPKELRYRVMLGDAYLQDGKADAAYRLYRNVLDEEPDNALAMYSLASYYEETGQKALYEQQIDSLLLNRKVDADTKVGVMRQLIIENEQAGGDSIRIIRLFDRIMQQEPDDASLPMLYAQYLLSKGMDEASFPVLREVLELDPTNTAARMILLGEAVRKEDYKEVISLCEAGVEASPDRLEFYFYLAVGYVQAERTDEAIETCLNALKHVDKDSKKEVVSDFYAIMGDAYHTKKMNREAYAAYESALEHNPDNIGALNNYAYYLSLERRDLDKAEDMSYRTVKAEPTNATYLDTYAWILFEKGYYAEARLYIDDAMKNDGGKSADVVEHCGDIYYMTGEVEEALKYWQQALEMGSESETLPQKIEQKKYISAPSYGSTAE